MAKFLKIDEADVVERSEFDALAARVAALEATPAPAPVPIPEPEPIPAPVPAPIGTRYEGAQGFAADCVGGRVDGAVNLIVDDFTDPPFTREDMLARRYKPGTLRWAMHQPVAKRIVFARPGKWEGWAPIQITDPAESANFTFNETRQPITIIGAIRLDACGESVWLNTRFRGALWNNAHRPFSGGPQSTGDCLNIQRSGKTLIDHCEFSGGADELFNIKNGAGDITIQWSLFFEAFKNGDFGMRWGDDNGHNYGSIIAHDSANTRSVTIHHCLYANLAKRCPNEVCSLPTNPPAKHWEWVNNVVYNWVSFAGSLEADTYSVIRGSTWRTGPQTPVGGSLGYAKGCYVKDSALERGPAMWPTEFTNTAKNPTILRGINVLGVDPPEPLHAFPVNEHERKEAIEQVLSSAGVFPLDNVSKANRDAVRNGTGWQGAHPDYVNGTLDDYLDWATAVA
jgi:hypothetical protein